MLARKFRCKFIQKVWLSPTVMSLFFRPEKKVHFEGGQFLSVVIPGAGELRPGKRAYSFASAPESDLVELCVRYYPGGRGSEYLKSLQPGEEFQVQAPYGHFTYAPRPGRSLCMIATGTGIAPFKSILESQQFWEEFTGKATLIFGARTEEEILYRDTFAKIGVNSVIALSKPGAGWDGFRGRVTDYLRTLPNHWGWHTTDFLICGGTEMTREVLSILREGHGVPEKSIASEVFVPSQVSVSEPDRRVA